MKWVVGRGSAVEVGCWSLVVGRGWVVVVVGSWLGCGFGGFCGFGDDFF